MTKTNMKIVKIMKIALSLLLPISSPRFSVIAALGAALLLAPAPSTAQEKAASETIVRFVTVPELSNSPRYSHVVEVRGGKMIFISGQVAQSKTGEIVGKGDFRAQAVQVYENLKSCLCAVNADVSHIVKTTTFLTDMKNLQTHREVRGEYFRALPHPPASTLVQITSLVDPDLLLEVEAIAVVPDVPTALLTPSMPQKNTPKKK